MYGLINQAVRDLVKSQHGSEKWAQVCQRAGVTDDDFIAMRAYPDSLTYALVQATAEVLGVSSEAVLRTFGLYWVQFTSEEGYGEMMDLFGRDFITCLKNLNGMHAHMGVMMPELKPPRFDVEELGPGRFRIHYFSKRAGLAPMVAGLIEGLAIKHGNRITLSYQTRGPAGGTGPDHDVFEVEVLG